MKVQVEFSFSAGEKFPCLATTSFNGKQIFACGIDWNDAIARVQEKIYSIKNNEKLLAKMPPTMTLEV